MHVQPSIQAICIHVVCWQQVDPQGKIRRWDVKLRFFVSSGRGPSFQLKSWSKCQDSSPDELLPNERDKKRKEKRRTSYCIHAKSCNYMRREKNLNNKKERLLVTCMALIIWNKTKGMKFYGGMQEAHLLRSFDKTLLFFLRTLGWRCGSVVVATDTPLL